MNINVSDWQIAILLVVITAILVVWFRSMLASRSQSRMYRMMARVGVFPRSDKRVGLDMQEVRARCRRCPAEDVCERWLAGEIEGDNGFCPNADVFDGVIKAR